jgi:hypothetical protein
MGASTADMTAINRAAADIVATQARDLVPVMSGRLRNTVASRARKTSGRVIAGRGRAIPYAGVIHFGWPGHNIDPNPFLYDALDIRKGEVVAKYQQHVAGLVDRLERETPG